MAETSTAKKKFNPFKAIAKYFRESKSEMKKVIWPSRKQVVNNTAVVIAAVVIIGIFIWVLDAVFQFGIFNFIK
ncbi:MAG: preprotein translocase subunit SecE [Ruminococcaceae bacterium]|nr:preprotein translocase subunit SecE [Oscillospiraceae bacterium]